MEVFKPGTRVKFGIHEDDVKDAVIVGVCIESGRLQYRVSYWSGGSMSTDWYDEFMVRGPSEEKLKIGFRQQGAL